MPHHAEKVGLWPYIGMDVVSKNRLHFYDAQLELRHIFNLPHGCDSKKQDSLDQVMLLRVLF